MHFSYFSFVSTIAGYDEMVLQKQISLGDEQAFKTLFDHYSPRLYHYILGIVKSKEVAEELVMDVFLKLWLAKDMMTEIENVNGFLFRIAYNKSIDFFRAVANDKQLTKNLQEKVPMQAQASADTSLLMQEYASKIREAIDLLPPQRKKIFTLSQEEGLTNLQIAQELGISKSTVNNTLVLARQFIKDYLAKNLDLVVLMTAISCILKNN